MGKYSIKLFNNLIEIYKEFGSIIVCYDFDSTVYDYKKTGEDYTEVINTLIKAKNLGNYVYVFTDLNTNTLNILESYLKQNNIPYDSINKCPVKVPFGNEGKPYYNILLDDKSGLDEALCVLNYFLDYINIKNE